MKFYAFLLKVCCAGLISLPLVAAESMTTPATSQTAPKNLEETCRHYAQEEKVGAADLPLYVAECMASLSAASQPEGENTAPDATASEQQPTD